MTCFTCATDLIEQLEQMATERSGLQDTSRRLASQLEREQVSHGEDLCVYTSERIDLVSLPSAKSFNLHPKVEDLCIHAM